MDWDSSSDWRKSYFDWGFRTFTFSAALHWIRRRRTVCSFMVWSLVIRWNRIHGNHRVRDAITWQLLHAVFVWLHW